MSVPAIAPVTPAISRLGRFYVTRELGRGTVGCVYLGHDPVIGREVAIKTFNPRLTPSERNKYEQQFINEARAAGRLAHPHIVTIYDASVENGATYIAMEYLQGRGLNRVLDSGHRFKPDEVASIVWRLADALNHAHQHQVIHRDIKPANIFMTEGDLPKLIDFGIARSPNRLADKFAHADDPVTLFHGNNVVGTPNYMSPEQASGKPIDERTDIYSLGAVMYEMLVGRPPFHAENADKLLQQVITKAPPAPVELDQRIPVVLSQIVMKAMSKRPEKRYQSAEQMALEIKRYLLKEQRARRRMRLALPPEAQSKREGFLASHSMMAWLGYFSLTAATVLTGFVLLR
ncbi:MULTISPECIES: serine/threonine-protein kinase [Oxalobacteraceae]|mgnify:CR=1 FL=1|jgi:serine/threonine-protein kinase|uniref:serine/threonine protein kinase n=1 Tax=Oxalobacteraceae TaxID=75682 RepID=UPI0010A31BE1|nr:MULTISPECIES: serine/threonine-protein kinase [Oxalobacteraceae]